MSYSLKTALSYVNALQRNMEIVAQNIANANTSGYKDFKTLLKPYEVTSPSGETTSYVWDVAMYRNMAQGSLSQTGNQLDVAINGEGFFAIETNEGVRYTRSGRFTLNEEGILVTQQGQPVLVGGGSIALDATKMPITIGKDGVISNRDGVIGRLDVVQFANPQNLELLGYGLYKADGQTPEVAENAEIYQGFTEDSNVQPIQEITNMIEVMRKYQSTSKMLETEHEQMRSFIRKMAVI